MYVTNEEWEQNNQDYLKESYEEPLPPHPGLPERPEMGWNKADSPRPAPFPRCFGGRVHLRSHEDIPAGSH